MKYSTTVEIDLPRGRVVALFDDAERYPAWQESLVGMERLEGEPGQVGTRTHLRHKMGRREITMLETVVRRDLPDVLSATYEAKGVWNQAINQFADLGGGRTRWMIETEFRCSGFMWLMTRLMPGMFKKQTRAVMEAFKTYAEGLESPVAPPEA